MQRFRRILHSGMKVFNHQHLCRFHVEHMPKISTRSFCTIWAGSFKTILKIIKTRQWENVKYFPVISCCCSRKCEKEMLQSRCRKNRTIIFSQSTSRRRPLSFALISLHLCYFASILFKFSILFPSFSFFLSRRNLLTARLAHPEMFCSLIVGRHRAESQLHDILYI